MSIVRPRQPALTRVVPHQGNRRYYVPQDGVPKKVLTVGDSWGNLGGVPDYNDYLQTSPGFAKYNQNLSGSTWADSSATYCWADDIETYLDFHLTYRVVPYVTCGINDLDRLSSALNTITLADLQTATTTIEAATLARDMIPIFSDAAGSSNFNAAANTIANEYSAWMAEFCHDRGYVFIPLRGMFIESDAIIPALARNSLHLNEAGCKILAQAVRNAIYRARLFQQP